MFEQLERRPLEDKHNYAYHRKTGTIQVLQEYHIFDPAYSTHNGWLLTSGEELKRTAEPQHIAKWEFPYDNHLD